MNHSENTEKAPHGQHAQAIEGLARCAAHMATSELIQILATVSAELEVRGVDVAPFADVVAQCDALGI